jgi:predicted transcriptional regulator
LAYFPQLEGSQLQYYICSIKVFNRILVMTMTTTIRLPPKLHARITALAKQTGRSAQSLILEAVERHVAYEEQMQSLVQEALTADLEIECTGEVYRAEDVHAWMNRLARGKSAYASSPHPGAGRAR